MCVCAQWLSCLRLFVTPWTKAHQDPLSMGFSQQESWSGLPFPPLADLPDPGIDPRLLFLQANPLTLRPLRLPIDRNDVNSKLHSEEVFEADFMEKEGHWLNPERQVAFENAGERVKGSICSIRVRKRRWCDDSGEGCLGQVTKAPTCERELFFILSLMWVIPCSFLSMCGWGRFWPSCPWGKATGLSHHEARSELWGCNVSEADAEFTSSMCQALFTCYLSKPHINPKHWDSDHLHLHPGNRGTGRFSDLSRRWVFVLVRIG